MAAESSVGVREHRGARSADARAGAPGAAEQGNREQQGDREQRGCPEPGHPLTLAEAHDRVAASALADAPVGAVGLEVEGHLVDLDRPAVRVPWPRVVDVVRGLPTLPGGSRVTVEPGGQVELSGPPAVDAATAVTAMRGDEAALRSALGRHRLGWALVGADPVRRPARTNPAGRYAAMERHFAATGRGRAGLVMMTSTCALQVNLQSGPRGEHAARLQQAHRLGPVLVALSACSAWLAGEPTGWRSSRQRAWAGLDQARCGPAATGRDPARAWARFALRAPVLLVRDEPGSPEEPVLHTVPMERWVAGSERLGGRRATTSDLDYHLTTLFPPVRPRGFLELRYLDAVPPAWWPGLVGVVVALMDSPRGADAAAEAAEPVADRWTIAARVGLADAALRRAATRCTEAAVAAAPPSLRRDVEAWAELVAAGRVPGDDVDQRAGRIGPLAVLEEECRA